MSNLILFIVYNYTFLNSIIDNPEIDKSKLNKIELVRKNIADKYNFSIIMSQNEGETTPRMSENLFWTFLPAIYEVSQKYKFSLNPFSRFSKKEFQDLKYFLKFINGGKEKHELFKMKKTKFDDLTTNADFQKKYRFKYIFIQKKLYFMDEVKDPLNPNGPWKLSLERVPLKNKTDFERDLEKSKTILKFEDKAIKKISYTTEQFWPGWLYDWIKKYGKKTGSQVHSNHN